MEIIGWLKGSGAREGYHGRAELTDPEYEAQTLVDDEASDPESETYLSWDPRGIQFDSSRHTPPAVNVRTVACTQSEQRDGSPAILPLSGGTKAFSGILPGMVPEQMKPKEQGGSALNNVGMYRAFDEFGFVKEEDEALSIVPNGVLRREDDQKLKWLAYFEFTQNLGMGEVTWDKVASVLPRSDRLLSLVKGGIPHSLRSQVWQRLTGSLKKKDDSQTPYRQILRKALMDNSTASAKQIEKDLLRTMPNNACFSSTSSTGVKRLRHILRALADFFPDLGYCQGTGMIAGTLLLLMEEEDVFWMMVAIIEEILPESYYNKTLMGVQIDQRVLKQVVSTILPKSSQLFKEHDTEISLVTLHWFITAFAAVVPTQVLLRIWDIFFCEGSISLFRISLALLKQREDEFLSLENSAAIFNCVSDAPSQVTVLNVDDLIESAFHLTSSLNDDILRVQRQVHLGELQRESGEQKESPGKRKRSASVDLQKVQRRSYTIERTHSGFLSLFGPLFRDGKGKAARTKNIEQTELVTELHDAIVQIAKHFQKDNVEVLSPDYSLQSHIRDHEVYIHSALASKKIKRGRAVIDFEPHDDDELGFKRNDIVTIISQRDDHCWIGELNGRRGWFPARFVRVLDERSKQYSYAGDDSVSDDVTDLVRGCLCQALKSLFDHGLKKPYFIGGTTHPWLFIEEVSAKEVSSDFRSVYARLVLCKTYNLEADGKVLTADEMLYRSVQKINMSHDAVHAELDMKFRSLVCSALNEQVLHLWLETLCSSEEVVCKWYHPSSYLRSPGWVQLKCELRMLASFSFNLSIDWEITEAQEMSHPIQESVRDMLVKHHLFSWDL